MLDIYPAYLLQLWVGQTSLVRESWLPSILEFLLSLITCFQSYLVDIIKIQSKEKDYEWNMQIRETNGKSIWRDHSQVPNFCSLAIWKENHEIIEPKTFPGNQQQVAHFLNLLHQAKNLEQILWLTRQWFRSEFLNRNLI